MPPSSARRLGVLAVISVVPLAAAALSGGCVSLTGGPRKPSEGDSLLASRMLRLALEQYATFATNRRAAMAATGALPVILDDLSLNGQKAYVQKAQRVGRMLDRVNAEALTPDAFLTLLTLRWEVEAQAERSAFFWTDFALLSPATSPLRDIVALQRHEFSSRGDAERYLYYIHGMSAFVQQIGTLLEERRPRGYVAPRAMVESAIAFLRAMRALGDEAPWYVAPDRLVALDSVDAWALRTEVRHAATTQLEPALDELTNYLEQRYLPDAPTTPGLWQYPGGKELYRHLLRRYSSLDVPPEEAHKIGVAELQRIDSLMANVRTQAGWRGSLAAFHDSIRNAPEHTASGYQAVVAAIEASQARLAGRVQGYFSSLEAPPAVIREATPVERLLFPDGGYMPPGATDAPGTLLLTPRWLAPGAQHGVAVRGYRLLVPGEHNLAHRTHADSTVPMFRRTHSSAGFREGWGEYAAALAGEMGLYDTPGAAYARLLDEGVQTALLVVDTGIHYLGWNRQQALSILRRYSLVTDAALDTLLTERVINDPGRATTAALGGREIAAMRAWMQRDLGADFTLAAWHGELLSRGALPLPIVGAHLEYWLYESGRAADAAARARADSAAGRVRRDSAR